MQAGFKSFGGPGLADPIGVLPPVVAIAADNKPGEALGSAQVALCSPALLALSGRPARVVAMQGARVLLDTVIALGSDGTGCLRCGAGLAGRGADSEAGAAPRAVSPPRTPPDRPALPPHAHLRFELSLRRLHVGVVSLHALLEDGGVTSLVHSAQLLALPPDAAAEVAGLLETMTTEVARFFEAAGCVGASCASSAWLSGAFSQSLAAGTAAGNASVSVAPESMLPAADPAACYAYDHYFRPFLESWGVLTVQQQQQPPRTQRAARQQQQQQQSAETAATAGEGGGGSQAAVPASNELLNTYRRLLDYLLDHELFCCAVLLMNQQPELALQNMNLGVDGRDGGVLPELLAALARASGSSRTSSSGSSSSSSSSSGSKVAALPQSSATGGAGSDGDAANLLLRQLQERATAAAAQQAAHQTPPSHRPATERQATSPARSPRLLSLWPEAEGPPLAAARQRKLEAELELLDARFTGELTLTHVRGRGALAPRPQQPQQQPCGYADKVVDWDAGEPASWAQCELSAPLPPPRPLAPVGACQNDGSRGCGGAAAQAATTGPQGAACSGAALDRAVPSDLLSLLRATACGFPSASVEGFYAVFKSHYSNLVDMTALLYSFGTWLTCASRSAALPRELAVLLLYCLLFFFPYAVMLTARSRYLRHREAMLTVARCSGILLVGGVAALLPPLLPMAWRLAVERTVTLHISHGVLLPACQQVRLQYALAIAAAHWLGDGGLLLRSLPLADAALSSAAIQVTGLVITVVLDACSRRVFLARYRGALAAELPGAACGGSTATGSAAICVQGGKEE
jgi:hypothetical protein